MASASGQRRLAIGGRRTRGGVPKPDQRRLDRLANDLVGTTHQSTWIFQTQQEGCTSSWLLTDGPRGDACDVSSQA